MELAFDTTTQEYIEVIYALEEENRVARVTDIAERRGVTKSSVSIVLNHLKDKKLIDRKQYGHITLTKNGVQLARQLTRRHQALKQFLIQVLGLSEQTAEDEACKLEHVVTSETLNRINDFLNFVEMCPQHVDRVFDLFKNCGMVNKDGAECDSCPPVMQE